MNDLIAEFLFAYNYCPLPGIGELRCEFNSSSYNVADKSFSAPTRKYILNEGNVDEQPLVKYISNIRSIPVEEAESQLNDLCNRIKSSEGNGYEMPFVGNFTVKKNGRIFFQQADMPEDYLPNISAERVSRKSVHSVLVGDNESNSEEMTEFFNASSFQAKTNWWVWALILLIMAVCITVFYLNDKRSNSTFGNAMEIMPKEKQAK